MKGSLHAGTYTEQLASAKHFLINHDDFLVVSHVNPDGDAASSTFAIGVILEQLGKRFTLVNEGKIPEKFAYLRGSDRIINYSSDSLSRSFQYVISVDCADFARIGAVKQLFDPKNVLLNIDHHISNDGFGHLNLIRTDAASTTEVIFDLVEACEISITHDLAYCLYTGLLTDTGGFRYSNTTPKVMQIASKLLQYGVDGPYLAEELLEKISRPHFELLKKSLKNLTFAYNNQIAWLSVSENDFQETGASNEDIEGLVNYPRNIEGVEVGLLFKQVDANLVKISFRSSGKVNVSVIAKSLGGGGHARAAGCTVKGTLDEVIEMAIKKVELALA